MGNTIKVYNLDQFGLVVDTNALAGAPGGFLKAQNAVADPAGESGSIRKRPGLKPFNTTVGAGTVTGGLGVPFLLGTSGPTIANPFGSFSLTMAVFTAPVSPSGTTQLGATFDDYSQEFQFDWNLDFSELATLLMRLAEIEAEIQRLLAEADAANAQAITDLLAELALLRSQLDLTGNDISGALNQFDPDNATLDLVDSATLGQSTASKVIPATYFGQYTTLSTPHLNWGLSFQVDLSDLITNATTYTNTKLKVFPTGSVAADSAGFDATYPLYNWWLNGSTSDLKGYPTAVLNNKLYYATGQGDYTVGTDAPTLRVFDAVTDTLVCRIPGNIDLSATAPARAITTVVAANSQLYLATFDGGVGGAAGGTAQGSVYSLAPATNRLTKLGTTFPAGQLPYALAWAYGRLWCGTGVNQTAAGVTPARVYWFRPGIDTVWTLDKTFAAQEAFVTGLTVFKGELYAAIKSSGGASTTGAIMKRTTLGVWSSVDAISGGFTAVTVWPPENSPITSPAAALFGNTLAKIRRSTDGATWAEVLAAVTTGFSATWASSSGTLSPVLWATGGAAILYNTVTGTAWTDRSAAISPANSATVAINGLLLQG